MREFGKLWTAGAISSLGDGVTLVAAPLLAASLTRDPVQIAGLMVAEQLPFVVFTLPGGAIVDRVDRRLLLAITSVVRVVCLGALGALVATGLASLPLLYAIMLLTGCAAVLFENASMTAIPAVVGPGDLERANGRMYASTTLCRSLLAPVVGAWLFVLAAWIPFALDATAFAVVVVLVLTLSRGIGRAPATRTTLRAAIAEGVVWLVRHRLLRTLAITISLENVSIGAFMSIMVLIAQERLGVGSVGYGLLVAAVAVGGVAGGLLAGRIADMFGPGTILRAGLIIEALAHLGLALTRDAILAGLIGAILGLHLIVFSTINASLRQSLAPPELLGRVHSAYRLISNGGMLLGALLGGVAARYFGLTAPFWLGLTLVATITALVWRTINNPDLIAARATAQNSRNSSGSMPRSES